MSSSSRDNDTSLAAVMDEVRDAYRGVRRRWWWIAIAVAAALAAALLFLLLVPPRYVSTAQILIDPRAKRIVEGAVVQGGFGSSAAGADTLLIDSQIEIMQSTAVLKKIVESERLYEDKEFVVPPTSGGLRILLRNTIGRSLFGNERELPPTTNRIDTSVWRFADKHLRIRRLGNTYVINVSVMSQDPAKAARLSNAVAQAYINDQVRATGATTREATEALQSRIEDLRKTVETAEKAVETFRTSAGLIGSPNLLVTEQQLQQTNDKLILARSQTALAKARYDQVKDLSAKSAALGAQSDALKSAVIANLRAGLSRVERREAIVQQTLRPGHPEYGNVLVEKRALIAQIEEELNRIKANARTEYELALGAEKALAAELKSVEAQIASGNQSQVRLRELQREAQSARTIYEQFLTRAKETSEQERLGRENSRIISEATVPPYPSFPPTLFVLCGALLAGMGAGIGTAWLAHVIGRRPSGSGASASPLVAPRIATVIAPVSRPASREPSASPVETRLRPRLRKMLAPLPASATKAAAPMPAETAPAAANDGENARRRPSPLATLAKLPGIRPRAPRLGNAAAPLPEPGFSDYIAAVDEISAAAYPGYRTAIDGIIEQLKAADHAGRGTVAMLVGAEPAAATSSTALAIAYRAAVTGRKTLLVDVAAADPKLSEVFATNLKQRRACILDSEAHLAEITLRDARTGLAMLPLALADLASLDEVQQRRLVAGLRLLAKRFDLVVMDGGSATTNRGMAFLAPMADKVLVITATASSQSQLKAVAAANRFRSRAAPASIIETASL